MNYSDFKESGQERKVNLRESVKEKINKIERQKREKGEREIQREKKGIQKIAKGEMYGSSKGI